MEEAAERSVALDRASALGGPRIFEVAFLNKGELCSCLKAGKATTFSINPVDEPHPCPINRKDCLMTEAKIEVEQDIETFTDEVSDEVLDRMETSLGICVVSIVCR